MAVDPMPVDTPPGTQQRHEPLLCEFCESRLTKRGQVIEISEKGKKLRRLQDQIDSQQNTIESQSAEIARLTSELAEAKAAAVKPAKARGGFFDLDDDEDEDEE